ncbi:hypothetical protein ncot_16390 [Nocardioides sp. JQ2195]|uniref:hypothetical protein n=1 Tax=Nocardioides sp. JQ2195 TaxID=2592334 RepID=UPI00143EB6A8|nr:hypothetical protein [Nocardioides sp. JQ2195]QIX27996.1 hypothetical protein ncot_16390 [Nocardioides sp. JQ2195]
MELTEDSFRALARSSPWRWQGLHFRRHGEDSVEAWVNRPGVLRVVDSRGRATVEQNRLEDSAGVIGVSWTEGEVPPSKPRLIRRWPHEVEPVRRADGLVAERPDDFEEGEGTFVAIEYGDPMYVNYHWVAMLDPRELGDHTSITDLRADEHRGRPVWRARVKPVEGYDPTCGCCALLWSEISDRDEYDDDWPLDPNRVHPEAYAVALDVETGIVVHLEPIGESTEDNRLDLEIIDVTPWPAG